jgi:hypothetical protein
MAELMELKATIAVAEERLAKAEREGKEELVLAFQKSLTELLKKENKLPEGAKEGTSTPLSASPFHGLRGWGALCCGSRWGYSPLPSAL